MQIHKELDYKLIKNVKQKSKLKIIGSKLTNN